MTTRGLILIGVLFLIFLLLDIYCYKGLKLLISGWSKESNKKWATLLFWGISISIYLALIVATIYSGSIKDYRNYKYFYYFFGIIILFLLPKLVFSLFQAIDDIGNGVSYIIQKAASKNGEFDYSRRKFITQTGAILAAVPFVSVAYGILKGRYDFKVFRETVEFDNLPKAFDGLKVVQFSDMHIGSFFNYKEPVEKAVSIINKLKPDIILFTGDFVNNYADELDGWEDVFSNLNAKMGKYSILGNHDYGDYVEWASAKDKENNLKKLIGLQQKMGFKVLMNDSVELEKNDEKISLIGMENWGKGGFSKYGNLALATKKVKKDHFKILLSHDPSHWDEEVLAKTDIDLSLAGHTHGMQFGVEIAGVKWSPVKWRYPRWAGLYKEGRQYLYVNRGLGYIGFPGRVGIWPEITLLELKSV